MLCHIVESSVVVSVDANVDIKADVELGSVVRADVDNFLDNTVFDDFVVVVDCVVVCVPVVCGFVVVVVVVCGDGVVDVIVDSLLKRSLDELIIASLCLATPSNLILMFGNSSKTC